MHIVRTMDPLRTVRILPFVDQKTWHIGPCEKARMWYCKIGPQKAQFILLGYLILCWTNERHSKH